MRVNEKTGACEAYGMLNEGRMIQRLPFPVVAEFKALHSESGRGSPLEVVTVALGAFQAVIPWVALGCPGETLAVDVLTRRRLLALKVATKDCTGVDGYGGGWVDGIHALDAALGSNATDPRGCNLYVHLWPKDRGGLALTVSDLVEATAAMLHRVLWATITGPRGGKLGTSKELESFRAVCQQLAAAVEEMEALTS